MVKLRKTTSRKTALPVDQPVSVFTLLRDYLELQECRDPLADRNALPAILNARRRRRGSRALMAGDAYQDARCWPSAVAVIDLLEQCPACALPFGVFLEMMPPLAPRYYSISSSPLVDPRRLSLTVAMVEGSARSGRGIYRGVCSNYLPALEGRR